MFDFKQFHIDDDHCAMKVGTDSVLLGAWTDPHDCRTILDMGCGSGLLALMMAQRVPEARIRGIEIDPAAAADAVINFAASPWHDRLSIICDDAVAPKGGGPWPYGKFDLIVCNPPFFANGLLSPDDRRALARHGMVSLSPETAITLAAQMLTPEGSIALVTPADLEDALVFHATMEHLRVWRICRVSTREGRPPSRLLLQLSMCHRPMQTTTLSIRDAENAYTPEYLKLTSDFYLHNN